MTIPAIYSLQYTGESGFGTGAMYIGNGTIAGFDMYGGRYRGSYSEQKGRFKATVTLSMPRGGQMVTGREVAAGSEIPLSVDWPSDFGNGKPQQIIVMGSPVLVEVQKMQDIP